MLPPPPRNVRLSSRPPRTFSMQRRTKIVATLGPASSDAATLTRLLQAGVDVVRLNFSHGTADDHRLRVETLRECMRATGRTIGIMVDLQGPKIRVGKFAGSKVLLKPGQEFILDATCTLGDNSRARLDYPDLIKDIVPGNVLLLDDGRIVLDVEAVEEDEILTRVRHGGELSNNKGINLLGGGLSAPALTPERHRGHEGRGGVERRHRRHLVPQVRL